MPALRARGIILAYRASRHEEPGGKERLDRFVGSFCAPCGAKNSMAHVPAGVNSCPALLRGRAALPTRPIGRAGGTSSVQFDGGLGPVRSRALDLHRSADGAVADRWMLHCATLWGAAAQLARALAPDSWKRFSGAQEEVQFVPAQPYTPGAGLRVRHRLVGDLGDAARPGAPRVGGRLAGGGGGRHRSSPPAIGSPSSRATASTASRTSAFAEERAEGRGFTGCMPGRSNKGRPAIDVIVGMLTKSNEEVEYDRFRRPSITVTMAFALPALARGFAGYPRALR